MSCGLILGCGSRPNGSQKIRRQACLGDPLERGIHGHTADLDGIDETDSACLQAKRNDREVEKMSQNLALILDGCLNRSSQPQDDHPVSDGMDFYVRCGSLRLRGQVFAVRILNDIQNRFTMECLGADFDTLEPAGRQKQRWICRSADENQVNGSARDGADTSFRSQREKRLGEKPRSDQQAQDLADAVFVALVELRV